MKGVLFIAYPLLILFFWSCRNDPYLPDGFLTAEQQHNLIRQTVYYSTKLPPNANGKDRFTRDFDWYYDRAARETKLVRYHKESDSSGYFLMSRVARSISPMREGIAGKVTISSSGKILKYEEVFRTWKMHEDSLTIRGKMLFERMVKARDLTLFYSKFQGDRFIEFPDSRFYFDKSEMRWRDIDSIKLR
ncbi:MAG: hypothetical protein WKF87_00360 [Chryseolinea sp.]